MIINCTPHAIEIYGIDAPDVIDGDATPAPVLVIKPSGTVARISEQEIGRMSLLGAEAVPEGVTLVEYGHVTVPPVRFRTWYVVSLATALAVPGRPDLLVPWRQVRNAGGTVIGCRGLARPRP